MAEDVVKTSKRDYVRVNPIPDAATALARIELWMHPHSRLGYRSPREYVSAQSKPAVCLVYRVNCTRSSPLSLSSMSVTCGLRFPRRSTFIKPAAASF
jgi:hypothetical protein